METELLLQAAPTPEQLEIINQYVPKGMPPLTAEEIVVLSIVAADNLITRGKGKWSVPDLYKLSDLLPGLPFTLDHDWDEVGKVVGRVFAARVEQSREVGFEILDRAGNYDWNRKIVQKEGHYQAIVDVFLQRGSAAADGLRYGRLSEVSVGGFRIRDLVCPLCEISFEDDNCPHLVPSPWLEYAEPATRKLAAPYYVRSGVYDLMELSLVTTPNCCNAGAVKDWGAVSVGGGSDTTEQPDAELLEQVRDAIQAEVQKIMRSGGLLR